MCQDNTEAEQSMTIIEFYACLQNDGFQTIRRVNAGDIPTLILRGRNNEIASIAAPETLNTPQRLEVIKRFRRNYVD
jgi:hypothetical protein